MMIIRQHGDKKHGKSLFIHIKEKSAFRTRCPTELRFGESSMRTASVTQSQGAVRTRIPSLTQALPFAVLIRVGLIKVPYCLGQPSLYEGPIDHVVGRSGINKYHPRAGDFCTGHHRNVFVFTLGSLK